MKNSERLWIFVAGLITGWLVYAGWGYLHSRQAVPPEPDGWHTPAIDRPVIHQRDAGQPRAQTPDREHPTVVSDATTCTCNPEPWLVNLCHSTPELCTMQGTCRPGQNRCGIDLPPGVSYDPSGSMTCVNTIRGDIWAFANGESRLAASYNTNGQLELTVPASRTRAPRDRWTWSAGAFWQNGTNWNNMALDESGTPVGGYCRLELGTDCRSLTAQCYPTGTNPHVGGQPQSTVHASYARPAM